jgi:hypothetical protein
MHGTPQPLVADVVAPLGQPMRPTAPDALVGRQGHGLPALVLGSLRAAADGPVPAREQATSGQREPVDRPAEVRPDLRGAWHGRWPSTTPPLAQTDSGRGRACLT